MGPQAEKGWVSRFPAESASVVFQGPTPRASTSTIRRSPCRSSLNLMDIDHIEVLKGPQGTLYGQASMGGTVRMVTVSPSTDAVAGTVDVDAHNLQGGGLGTFNSFKVNVPLSNDMAMR